MDFCECFYLVKLKGLALVDTLFIALFFHFQLTVHVCRYFAYSSRCAHDQSCTQRLIRKKIAPFQISPLRRNPSNPLLLTRKELLIQYAGLMTRVFFLGTDSVEWWWRDSLQKGHITMYFSHHQRHLDVRNKHK